MDGKRKLKVVALGTVSAVQIVGFSTPSWAFVEIVGETDTYHYGLWQHCFHGVYGARDCFNSGKNDPAWLRPVQILQTMGLVGLLISVVISTVLKCFKQRVASHHRTLTIFKTIVTCCTGICITSGVIVFGTSDFNEAFYDFERHQHGDLGYSFFLCAGAGGFLLLVYTPILLYEICTRGQPKNSHKSFSREKDEKWADESHSKCICENYLATETADNGESSAHALTDAKCICQNYLASENADSEEESAHAPADKSNAKCNVKCICQNYLVSVNSNNGESSAHASTYDSGEKYAWQTQVATEIVKKGVGTENIPTDKLDSSVHSPTDKSDVTCQDHITSGTNDIEKGSAHTSTDTVESSEPSSSKL